MSSSAQTQLDRKQRFLYGVLVLTPLALMWLRWLNASFWLDETGTSWVTGASLHQAIVRSKFEGQTPLFYVIVWGVRRLFGGAEWALRLPSVLSAVLALFILFGLARRLFDEETAWLSVIAFVSIEGVAFAAADARPYAIGMAVVIGSTFVMVRWLDEPTWGRLSLWVALSTAAIWLSYTFAVAIIPQLIYAAYRMRKGKAGLSKKALLLSLVALAFVSLPATPHFLGLFHQSDIVPLFSSGDRAPRITEVVGDFLPASLIGVLFAVSLTRILKGTRWRIPRSDSAVSVFVLLWTFLPPLVFYALSLLWTREIFRPRYFIYALSGAAVTTAWLARGFAARALRASVAIAIVVAAIASYRGGEHRQDWRLAAKIVNENSGSTTPILMNSGFPSSALKLGDPASGFIAAPFMTYAVRGRILYLPNDLGAGDIGRLNDLARSLARVDKFILVESFERWNAFDALEVRLRPDGYVGTIKSLSLDLRVSVFTRSTAT